MTQDTLLASTFLFRFAAPCRYRPELWPAGSVKLDEEYTLPCFGELEDKPLIGDLRGAWSEQGLAFTLRVSGKKQPPRCRGSRLDESDGLHVWIDTRDTHNIHRATRFCHRFVFTPSGGGGRLESPIAQLVPIRRAREEPKELGKHIPQVRSEKRVDGYVLEAHIPALAMTGFDPTDHQRVGFYYAIVDRELGWQTFSLGPEFPVDEDPSLWGSLDLVRYSSSALQGASPARTGSTETNELI